MTPENWWSAERRDGLREAFGIEGEDWKENDELLRASLELVDKFHWQSHTMSHLARDNLGETDCFMEDNGKEEPGGGGGRDLFRVCCLVGQGV